MVAPGYCICGRHAPANTIAVWKGTRKWKSRRYTRGVPFCPLLFKVAEGGIGRDVACRNTVIHVKTVKRDRDRNQDSMGSFARGAEEQNSPTGTEAKITKALLCWCRRSTVTDDIKCGSQFSETRIKRGSIQACIHLRPSGFCSASVYFLGAWRRKSNVPRGVHSRLSSGAAPLFQRR
jgi:hypothetical protein